MYIATAFPFFSFTSFNVFSDAYATVFVLHLPVGTLSGGNQQKVVIAKWLGMDPQLIILDEPTRGIDVGAKKDIYDLMNKLTEQGVSIIMVSSELPEVLGMSDRIMVIHEGTVAGILESQGATQESVITLATGGK